MSWLGHQRPQAELEAAAFRRLRFGRLGLHGRIIPDRSQTEQGILHDGRGRVMADSFPYQAVGLSIVHADATGET